VTTFGRLEQIISGMGFTEGPLWMPDHQQLLFTDIPRNRIWSWSEDGGQAEWLNGSHFAIGLARSLDGNVLACEHTTRSLTSLEVDDQGRWAGRRQVLARGVGGRILNSPNDVIVTPTGEILFTDPPFGVREEDAELTGYEQAMERPCDVLAVTRDPDNARVAVTGIYRPNGLCHSLDGDVLYVSDSSTRVRSVLAVRSDALAEPIWTMPNGVPDGMTVDAEGDIWVGGGDGVYVISETGQLRGHVPVPEMVTNVCFGGSDMTSLFITASSGVYRLFDAGLGAVPSGTAATSS